MAIPYLLRWVSPLPLALPPLRLQYYYAFMHLAHKSFYEPTFTCSFDGLVIHISFILLIVEASSPSYTFLAAARPFKFFRFLKLKRSYRDIMRTLFVLSHRLLSAIILLVLIYYFFAIIGLEFFSDAVYENCW